MMREGFTDASVNLENLFDENSINYLENRFQVILYRQKQMEETYLMPLEVPMQNQGK